MNTTLDNSQAWITIRATPSAPAVGLSPLSGEVLAKWVRSHTSPWPAPIPIGAEKPHAGPGVFTFSPDEPAGRYEFNAHTDGSSSLRLPAGGSRRNPTDGETVWAIGEGALAWISIAAVRLASAHASRLGCRGDLSVEIGLGESTPTTTFPYEIWNRGNDGFHPVGTRVPSVRPCRSEFSLVDSGTAELPSLVRPLLIDLLGRFGLTDSRHIDVDGVVRRRNFTGHDDRIRSWTTAIGLASKP
ncbi:hypothetical protein ACFFQW_44130 [Umezawaea endophytica]|uniref:Uncharacterized protein n=1 Tax=Umezawaea endophytica TaxID=1654476 RepID=A0A9X2VII5_9PSEU|nr:hypothetical protein [Umezawaea endophytica]MCS7477147.1 hypothetical protein [Umezawaea endophytica]